MSNRRRLLVAAGGGHKSLYIYTGVDTRMVLTLSGDTLVCRESGGAGTHGDLSAWSSPPLLLGRAVCYYRNTSIPAGFSNADIIDHASELFSLRWEMGEPLPLGFTPAGIASVELIGSGRDQVTCGEEFGDCWINWDDGSVTVNDSTGSSSMYCFRINFK